MIKYCTWKFIQIIATRVMYMQMWFLCIYCMYIAAKRVTEQSLLANLSPTWRKTVQAGSTCSFPHNCVILLMFCFIHITFYDAGTSCDILNRQCFATKSHTHHIFDAHTPFYTNKHTTHMFINCKLTHFSLLINHTHNINMHFYMLFDCYFSTFLILPYT